MTRDDLDGAILDWLEAHVSTDDFGILGETMIVLRGARGKPPVVLVPVPWCHRPSKGERLMHGRLRAAGVRVLIVRSVAEVQMAATGLRAPAVPLIRPAIRQWVVRTLAAVQPTAWRAAA
jgi:hypothetical protein